MLTAVQQDYIEIIYRLETDKGIGAVRISDIAAQLGTRLPTVTRTVRKLTDLGFIRHESRRQVGLTDLGRTVAMEILHRHEDLVRFLTDILGLPHEQAQIDAGQMEHGLSGRAAQRLHEFLDYFESLTSEQREPLDRFLETVSGGRKDFRNLPTNKIDGWRT